MLDEKTKERIAKDALKARTTYVKEEAAFGTKASSVSYMGISFKEGYIAGAEAEAERSSELISALQEYNKMLNEELNLMEKHAKGYEFDGERVSKGIELFNKIEALNQYNKP